MGVAANEVQQDADTVGTALKTMSMRLRGSKTDLIIRSLVWQHISKQSAQNRENPEVDNPVGKISNINILYNNIDDKLNNILNEFPAEITV